MFSFNNSKRHDNIIDFALFWKDVLLRVGGGTWKKK